MLIHTESRSILLRARPEAVAKLQHLFPRQHRRVDFEGHNLALPHTLETVKVLRNMGIKAPSPIRYYYDWPRPARFARVFDHQFATADFLTLHHKRCFVLNEMGCVDAATEYLSPAGWRRIDQYDGGQVMQYDLATGAGEFVQPTEYVKLPCDEMIRFKTDRGVDQLLSAEHRVLYWGSTGKPAVKPAREVESAYHSTERGWSGRFATTFKGTGGSGIALTDEQLRVQVAVIADGYFGKATPWCVVRLKRERKVARMRALLGAADIDFKETVPEYAGAEGFHIFRFNAPIRVKEFDARFWGASVAQLHLLADELHRWDGSERKSGAVSFVSTSKASADFAQYVYAATGRTASISYVEREAAKDLWVVHARQGAAKLYLKGATNDGEKHANVWREPSPDGFKYCFEVPKTFLVLRRNGCVFVTGNTSKTASMLWAADYLMSLGLVQRVLIVAPMSTLEQVWRNEIFDVCMHRTAAVLHATADKRRERLAHKTDFYIVNHSGLKIIANDVIQRDDIDLIIVDEAADYRNAQTDRYEVLAKVAAKKKLWMASGAPTPNAPTDAWALARLVSPGRVPQYFTQFKRQTMNQITQFKWSPKPGSHADAYAALQPAVRFKKADCLDLPPVTYTTRSCALSPEQEKAYVQMKNYLVAEAATTQITAVNAADKIGKLRQILCGAIKDPDGKGYTVIPHGPRFRVLMEAIEQAAAKVLVIVPFKGIVHALHDEIMAHHTREKDGKRCDVVNGDVSIANRNKIFQEFRDDPNLNELICHPAVMSHGLNMTQADMVIFYAPIYSNDQSGQVMDRINRPGQTRKMTIVRISAGPLEDGIYRMVEGKRESQETMLALYKKELML